MFDLGRILLGLSRVLTYAPLVMVDYKVIGTEHDSLPVLVFYKVFFFMEWLIAAWSFGARLTTKYGLLSSVAYGQTWLTIE